MNVYSTKQAPFWPIILAVFFGNFLAILSTSTINVALPVLMSHFETNLSSAQWAVTGFMLATGIIAPIVGYLGDKLSYKNLYVYTLIGFTLFSVLCATAWNIESLITFRILQGICSGIVMPTTMTIIYQVIEKEKQTFAISLWSVSAMFAPAFGPTLGGLMTEYFGWKSLFLMNLPIGIIAIIIAARFVPYYRLSHVKSFDAVGFVTVIVSSASFLVAFSLGNSWGWLDGKTIFLLVLGLISLSLFIFWELRTSEPLLNLRVFKYTRYTYSVILNCVIGISLYSSTFLIPVFSQSVQHTSALHTGLILLPGSLAMILFTLLIGKVYGKVGPMWLSFIGIVLIGIATWKFKSLTPQSSFLYLSLWMGIRYIGTAFSHMPVNNAGMSVIPREYSGHASSINNWTRQVIGSFSIGIFSAILASRTFVHTKELQHINSKNTMLHEQAMSLGMNDVFFLTTVIVILTIPLTFTLKKKRKYAAETAL